MVQQSGAADESVQERQPEDVVEATEGRAGSWTNRRNKFRGKDWRSLRNPTLALFHILII